MAVPKIAQLLVVLNKEKSYNIEKDNRSVEV